MSGTNRVDLDVNGGDAVVKLAGNAKWIGEFNAGAAGSATRGGSIVVDGPASATLSDDGSSLVYFGDVQIGVNVKGTGTIDFLAGKLEFIHGVGAGQTVDETGYHSTASLILDDPKDFAGLVNFTPISEWGAAIDLEGLAKADSYAFKNDILSIYGAHNKLIDTLKLNASSAFSVEKSGSTVVVWAFYNPDPSAMALPMRS